MRSQHASLQSISMKCWARADFAHEQWCRPFSHRLQQSAHGSGGGTMQWIPWFKHTNPEPHAHEKALNHRPMANPARRFMRS
jgi:hypothetical protein